MKKKVVIELGQLKEIPEDHIKCGICGTFHPVQSFNNDNSLTRSRINCKSCYEATSAEWDARKKNKEIAEAKLSDDAKAYIRKNQAEDIGISVKDLIEALFKLPPDSKIVITQEGYYSDGPYASIHLPEVVKELSDLNVYSIGHSQQSA